MKKQSVNLFVLLLACLLGYVFLVNAQDDTGSPFAELMDQMEAISETQTVIYDVVVEGSSGVSERDGRFMHLQVPAYSTLPLLDEPTVPEGKMFVILKWCPEGLDLLLTVDDNTFVDPRWFLYIGLTSYNFDELVYNFPDKCVVVNAG